MTATKIILLLSTSYHATRKPQYAPTTQAAHRLIFFQTVRFATIGDPYIPTRRDMLTSCRLQPVVFEEFAHSAAAETVEIRS